MYSFTVVSNSRQKHLTILNLCAFTRIIFGPGSSHGFPFLSAQDRGLGVTFLDVVPEATDLGFMQDLRTHHAKRAPALRPIGHQVVEAEPPWVTPTQPPLPWLAERLGSLLWSSNTSILTNKTSVLS